jgi:hypothetical protein
MQLSPVLLLHCIIRHGTCLILHTITNDVKKIVKEKKSVKEGESLSALPLFVYFILPRNMATALGSIW